MTEATLRSLSGLGLTQHLRAEVLGGLKGLRLSSGVFKGFGPRVEGFRLQGLGLQVLKGPESLDPTLVSPKPSTLTIMNRGTCLHVHEDILRFQVAVDEAAASVGGFSIWAPFKAFSVLGFRVFRV